MFGNFLIPNLLIDLYAHPPPLPSVLEIGSDDHDFMPDNCGQFAFIMVQGLRIWII